MGKLVVISGPSGVGKGTVINLLKDIYQEKNEKLYLSISCTTRSPRVGEVEGVSYYFISENEFQRRIDEEDFLEYNKYGTGKFYGTSKSVTINYLNKGYDVILEIDINGYRQIKERFPDCVGIFIMPPSIEELYNRLKNRNTEDEDVIKTRLKTAKYEIENNEIYDYVIVNENNKSLKTAKKIYQILKK